MPQAPNLGNLNVTDFTVGGMLRAGIAIRKAVRGAKSLEEAADRIVRFLYDHCTDAESGERTSALVRFFKTHPFDQLEPELQLVANAMLDDVPASPWLRCLTLMATAGDEPAWNSRQQSRGHRVIPLPSAERVRAAPMIMRLIEDMGVDLDRLVAEAQPEGRGPSARTYDVFHVEHALGSPFIPAQREFVIPHHIESVVGFGGLLRSGELFAVIIFSCAHIPVESAARFRSIALDIRSSLFNFDDASTWRRAR